jgi:hypothetical protein
MLFTWRDGASLDKEGGAPFFLAWVWVYIRFFGNGGYWFRPYGGSLLEERQK